MFVGIRSKSYFRFLDAMKRDFKLIQLELHLFCLNLLCDLVSENLIFTDFYKLELIAVFVVVGELSIL